MGALIAVLNKEGGNAAETALKMLEALSLKADAYGLATPMEVKIEKTTKTLKTHDLKSETAIGYAFTKILENDKPQPLKLRNATLAFEGRLYPATEENPLCTITEELGTRAREAAVNLIKKTEGDFAFAIAEPRQIVAGRDTMGTRPLYYGENTAFTALASQRRALWKIGITRTESFPPGHTALLNKHGFTFEPARTLKRPRPTETTLEQAAKRVPMLLEKSVADRVGDAGDVTVAFSGGLDSTLVAVLARNAGANVHLIHVSLREQEETHHARETADDLGLPIHTCLHDKQDIKAALPTVLKTIEEADPVKVAIGIPFLWAAEKAADMGFNVMLAGQGADELFGGYKRYTDIYAKSGKETAEKSIFNDVAANCRNNIERDAKICSFHGVELRLPFASYELTRYALSLPLELNIAPPVGSLRKLVLRRTAENLGLPDSVVHRPKKAIQYATGVSKALSKLAKENKQNLKTYLQNAWRRTQETEGNAEWTKQQ